MHLFCRFASADISGIIVYRGKSRFWCPGQSFALDQKVRLVQVFTCLSMKPGLQPLLVVFLGYLEMLDPLLLNRGIPVSDTCVFFVRTCVQPSRKQQSPQQLQVNPLPPAPLLLLRAPSPDFNEKQDPVGIYFFPCSHCPFPLRLIPSASILFYGNFPPLHSWVQVHWVSVCRLPGASSADGCIQRRPGFPRLSFPNSASIFRL